MLLCQSVKDSSSLHSVVVSRYLVVFVNVTASAFVKVPMDLLPKQRSSGEWNASHEVSSSRQRRAERAG